jgi:hypothetical protein
MWGPVTGDGLKTRPSGFTSCGTGLRTSLWPDERLVFKDQLLQFPGRCFNIGALHDCRDHCNPVCPCCYHFIHVFMVYAPDGDKGKGDSLPDFTEPAKPMTGAGIILRQRGKRRAEGKVIRTRTTGREGFLNSPDRNPDDKTGRSKLPGGISPWPRWTPSASHAIAISSRSFTMKSVPLFIVIARRIFAVRRISQESPCLSRSWMTSAPPAIARRAIPTGVMPRTFSPPMMTYRSRFMAGIRQYGSALRERGPAGSGSPVHQKVLS